MIVKITRRKAKIAIVKSKYPNLEWIAGKRKLRLM